MPVCTLGPLRPDIDPCAWIADSAQIIGQVHLAAHSSVWFGAVLRGDADEIRIGGQSNVQDGSVLHCDPGYPLRVGARVTVGHRVVLHGCTVGDECLIGMGAIILNGAQIGPRCLVGAGSLIPAGKVFAEGSLILGSPARVVRALSPEEMADLARSALRYVERAQDYRAAWQVRA